MTDLAALSRQIATRLRAMPEIDRLYPPKRRPLDTPITSSALLTAITAEDSVGIHRDGDLVRVEVTVAVRGAIEAPRAAESIARVAHDELDRAGIGPRAVVVRVAAIRT